MDSDDGWIELMDRQTDGNLWINSNIILIYNVDCLIVFPQMNDNLKTVPTISNHCGQIG